MTSTNAKLALAALCIGSCFARPPSRDTSWHKYVRAPASTLIKPKAIISTQGSVDNAQALINGQGVATLNRPTSDSVVPSITLDMGINSVGFTQVHFAGASNNNPGIRLTFSETQQYLGATSDFSRSDNGQTITPGTDQHAVPSTPSSWNDTYGCQYCGNKVCADGLHGYRYVRIALDALESDAGYTAPNGTVNISSLALDFYGFHGTPDTFTGWFECSDANITQWWYDAAYTNEITTAVFTSDTTEPRNADSPTLDGKWVLFDGAKRDRDPYVGDLAVSARTAFITHSQTNIAAMNVLADLADHQRSDGWIPPASINGYTLPLFDYPLHWVVSSWDYILFSGDTSYASKYWPNLVSALDHYYASNVNASSGLLSKPSGYGDYAFLPRQGQVTYYNALYVHALQNAAAWAKQNNQADAAQRWTTQAASISNAVNSHLWDASAGAYLDSTDFSSSNNEARHAQDGNGIAAFTGLAPVSRAQSALNYLTAHNKQDYGNAFYDGPISGSGDAQQRVYAFTSFFELQGRFVTPGMSASALEEIRRLYGWMSSHDPYLTHWEGIGPNGSPYEQGFTSMAHGWSTGIVSLTSNFVLGINPTSAGFATWQVKPYPSGLQYAKGQIGTPKGPLAVSWTAGSSFQLSLAAPQGTSGVVSVPAKNGQKIYLDGKLQKVKPDASGYATISNVGAGTHKITVS